MERLESRLMLTGALYETTTLDPLFNAQGTDILDALPEGMAGQFTDNGLEITPATHGDVYVPHYIMLDSSPQLTVYGDLAPFATSTPTGMTPFKMRHAYGIDQIMFGGIQGDGT